MTRRVFSVEEIKAAARVFEVLNAFDAGDDADEESARLVADAIGDVMGNALGIMDTGLRQMLEEHTRANQSPAIPGPLDEKGSRA